MAERKRNVPCLALSMDEAAEALSVSRDFLDEHIRHELRVVRRGRKVLVPVRELERRGRMLYLSGSAYPA